MYIGPDSIGLVNHAPRDPVANVPLPSGLPTRAIDVCCGSGVQVCVAPYAPATPRPVQTSRSCLCACYAMSGTDVAYGATRLWRRPRSTPKYMGVVVLLFMAALLPFMVASLPFMVAVLLVMAAVLLYIGVWCGSVAVYGTRAGTYSGRPVCDVCAAILGSVAAICGDSAAISGGSCSAVYGDSAAIDGGSADMYAVLYLPVS
eukprot:1190842-Rhodomonas_salina.1